jgi:uncharacterized protein (DUF433 family)
MNLIFEPSACPLTADAHGVVRVGETRVTLETVVHSFLDGSSAEVIVLQFPTLQLADVYAAIAYYLRNQQQVNAYLQARQVLARQVQERIEANYDPAGIRARLLARQDFER